MKKQLFAVLSAAAIFCVALSFAGCTSVTVSDKGADMVEVRNSGLFLFFCLPLFSGDPNYPNEEVCNWFENTVKLETNVRLLEEEAAKQGARGVRNVASHMDDETIIPIFLKQKIYRTSAELIRD